MSAKYPEMLRFMSRWLPIRSLSHAALETRCPPPRAGAYWADLGLDRLIDRAGVPHQLVKHAALGEPCLGAHAVFP